MIRTDIPAFELGTSIAKLAYLTTPYPGRFIINIQPLGMDGEIIQYEIAKHHLCNIIIDGTALVLRETSTIKKSENAA